MYLYQPCLLSMSLFAWAFEETSGRERWLEILTPLCILALSEAELIFSRIRLYPAGLLFPLPFMWRRVRSASWGRVLIAALSGALLSWKAADAWPLFTAIQPLCAGLLLIPAFLFCREREDRLLACALGSLAYELFFCMREYMLFAFCILRLGSRDALSLGTMGVCILLLFRSDFFHRPVRKNHPLLIRN